MNARWLFARGGPLALALLIPHAAPLAQAALLVPTPSLPGSPPQLARGGGFGGGGGFGRGGGGGGFGAGRSGFQDGFDAGGLNRGATSPTGGWTNGLDHRAPAPSLDGDFNRSGFSAGSESGRSGSWSGSGRSIDASTTRNASVNANWNRDLTINNVNLNPGWARPGWGYARPWSTGWYGGWATPAWGWWAGSAALWGVSTLATAAVINSAVTAAVTSGTTTIAVPNSGYQLLFGTVLPSGSQGVSFVVEAGGIPYALSADCALGTINGVIPSTAAQAELLNAACQVAYGAAG